MHLWRYVGWPMGVDEAHLVERERLLSMLTVFLGPTSMRELGLPRRPPWAFGLVVALNVLRDRVLGRLPGGEDAPEVGALPT